MYRLSTTASLFNELATNPPTWWNQIISDDDLYIDIRKENYIDVYYHGGSVIRELKFDGKKYSGKTHYKYLLPDKADYINYDFSGLGITTVKKNIDLLPIHSLDSATLGRIKANISYHYPSSSEKGIQSMFVKNARQFLDSEFAYSFGSSKIRIDLVWIDITNEKIIFVELKTIGDQRVYNTKIVNQLTDYNNFAKSFKSDIEVYYNKVFDIKKRLGILPVNLKTLNSLKTFSLEVNPLLLFGDCEQQWIDNNATSLDARIRGVAVGCYYFGGTSYNCDLIPVSKQNRHIL